MRTNNFLGSLFYLFVKPEVNVPLELENAVRADDVHKAYDLLSKGADANIKISYTEEEQAGSHWTEVITVTRQTCLLQIAKSEPMKRLLRHFGALSLSELKNRWEEEEALRKNKEQEEQKAEQQRIASKAAEDTAFLDSVLK